MGVTPIIRTGCHSAEGARWWCNDEVYAEMGCELDVSLVDPTFLPTNQKARILRILDSTS